MLLRRYSAVLVALTIVVWSEDDAQACGGCFAPPEINTQVTSHRMVLSISMDQTSLWDQILYVGEPESFAWVLPINGLVDVGLSSDVMFQVLEQMTVVQVFSPPACGLGGNPSASASEDSDGSSGPSKGSDEESVEVLANEVVGPYETVQLSSEDPQALRSWLEEHGYAVPADIEPIIDDYVLGGFDFLALKLVPGAGVDAMRPVRISTPGALPALPLRMVAAGTGALTPISLWIIGAGRYQAANMENFLIHEEDLVWDWDSASSNYRDLRQAGFESANGQSWLTEVVAEVGPLSLRSEIEAYAYYQEPPAYDDEAELADDLDALVGHFNPMRVVVTRLGAELSRDALDRDLFIEAAADQSEVSGTFNVTQAIGTEPVCPPPRDDDDWFFAGGCKVAGSSPRSDALLLLFAALALWLGKRRR